MKTKEELMALVKSIWQSQFNTPFPLKSACAEGTNHRVILVGNSTWEYMFRFGITHDVQKEYELFEFLNSHNPPISLAQNVEIFETQEHNPYNKCLIQIPVNGIPLTEFLKKHNDKTIHQNIGEQIGLVMKWLNNLPSNLFKSEDALQKDMRIHLDDNLHKLLKTGVGKDNAQKLLNSVINLFDTQVKLVPCHGDLGSHHIFINEGNKKVGVIDWGDYTVAEPIRDMRLWYWIDSSGRSYKDIFPDAYDVCCKTYRGGFPLGEEDKRLQIYSLAGILANDEESVIGEIQNWVKLFGPHFM